MMAIKAMKLKHADQCIFLWDKLIKSEELLYKCLTKNEFISKFIHANENYKIKSFIYEKNNVIIGFSSGVIVKEKNKAYITTIVVEPHFRRQKIGTQLLEAFENDIKSNYTFIDTIDIIFFNPVQFEWIIPNTNQHDHPNAPGVDSTSKAYNFFCYLGYVEFAKQNSYYKNIENYTYNEEISSAINHLKDNDITITFYDQQKHHGFSELFENLKNPYWHDEITKAIDNNLPILVAEKKGLIVGFTGPLRVQKSLRGFFSGIGVHSDYRGYGAGKVLFSTLCLELSHIGAHYMTLFTGEHNSARRIYEKEGFKIVRSWANMRKELKQ